ncbi:hypothetical protein OUZ56_026841 [Daphnia magna]|uniref:Uncharacterized protein n=1 Tax=Daphnia magna TaxID=35525 RepID=A0ABQ9ZMZ3_9CRUS|nr:hypothetical protein OUZ56_026841 [Daphnia magna]
MHWLNHHYPIWYFKFLYCVVPYCDVIFCDRTAALIFLLCKIAISTIYSVLTQLDHKQLPYFPLPPVQNPPSELRPCLLPAPSPHRCLPLRFRLWVIAVFVYAFSFASSLSSYRPPSSIQQLKNTMA